jgi:predicted MPP superfamily phosphohydrolase
MNDSATDSVDRDSRESPERLGRLTRRRFLKLFGLALSAGGVGYGVASNLAEVTNHPVPLRGLRRDLRVLMVADAHLPACFVSAEELRQASTRFDPHVLVIVGDSIDKRGNEGLVDYFAGLEAPGGKLAVLGNWEYWGDCDLAALRRDYERIGVHLLVNEAVNIRHAGADVHIVGLDDLLGGHPRIELVAEQGETGALLVLAHCPALFDEVPDRWSVTLAGHTHGGQVAPFGVKLAVPPGSGSYFRGWYESGPRRLFVTRGMGNSVTPFRVGSRPEIVQLTFRPTS